LSHATRRASSYGPKGSTSAALPVAATPRTASLGFTLLRTDFYVGQRLAFTGGISGNGRAPTGLVSFDEGRRRIGSTTVEGAAFFPWTLAAGDIGLHTFTIHYAGDDFYAPATSGPVSFTVAANNLPQAALTRSALGTLDGWAADHEDPEVPLVVQVWVDGVLRGSFVAAGRQPDQPPAFAGYHGFAYRLPPLAAGVHGVALVTYDPSTGVPVVFATTQVSSDSLYFDKAWYLAQYPDVAAALRAGAISSAWQHFQAAGAHEGRNPSAFFNEQWYRATYPDIAAAVGSGRLTSGFAHFVASGSREGRDPSPYFNELYYRRAYADVNMGVGAGVFDSGFAQFLSHGLTEGRSPTPWFDAAAYRILNADVDSGLTRGVIRSAFEHFIATGAIEQRSPAPWFDGTAYLTLNPDLAAALSAGKMPSAFVHFMVSGLNEGRQSDASFDSAWYLGHYPDAVFAVQSGMLKSAFQHYLLFGRLSGHQSHS
jgi:hypothetical protein